MVQTTVSLPFFFFIPAGMANDVWVPGLLASQELADAVVDRAAGRDRLVHLRAVVDPGNVAGPSVYRHDVTAVRRGNRFPA